MHTHVDIRFISIDKKKTNHLNIQMKQNSPYFSLVGQPLMSAQFVRSYLFVLKLEFSTALIVFFCQLFRNPFQMYHFLSLFIWFNVQENNYQSMFTFIKKNDFLFHSLTASKCKHLFFLFPHCTCVFLILSNTICCNFGFSVNVLKQMIK